MGMAILATHIPLSTADAELSNDRSTNALASSNHYEPASTMAVRRLDPAASEVVRRFSRWSGPYSTTRAKLFALGWRPDPKADCFNNLVDPDNALKICQEQPNNTACRACQATPELASCSEGPVMRCEDHFINPASREVLLVTTGGDTYAERCFDYFSFIPKSSPDR